MNPNQTRLTKRHVSAPLLSKPQITQVVARPVDMYVKPVSEVVGSNTDTRNAKLLNDLLGGVVKIAGYYYNDKANDAYLKGIQDAEARKEFNPNEHKGFWGFDGSYANGYRGVEDEAKAIDFTSKLKAYQEANNYWQDSKDPRAEQERAYVEIYNQIFTPDYLTSNGRDGIMSEAGLIGVKRGLLNAEADFNQAHISNQKEKLTQSAGVIIKDTISNLDAKNELNPNTLGANLYSLFDELKTNQFGSLVSEDEYLSRAVDELGASALDAINVGNFKKANNTLKALKGLKNRDGVLLTDIIEKTDTHSGDKVYSYRNKITQLEANLLKTEEQQKGARQEAANKAKADNTDNVYAKYMAIQNIDDPLVRSQQEATLLNNIIIGANKGSYDASKLAPLAKLLQTGKSSNLFAKTTDQQTLYAVKELINQDPNISVADLTNAVNGRVTQADFDELLKVRDGLKDKTKGNTLKAIRSISKNIAAQYGETIGADLTLKFTGSEAQKAALANFKHEVSFIELDVAEGLLDRNTALSKIGEAEKALATKMDKLKENNGVSRPTNGVSKQQRFSANNSPADPTATGDDHADVFTDGWGSS